MSALVGSYEPRSFISCLPLQFTFPSQISGIRCGPDRPARSGCFFPTPYALRPSPYSSGASFACIHENILRSFLADDLDGVVLVAS